MTLNSIKKIRLPRKTKKRFKQAKLFEVSSPAYPFVQEAELKEKYRYSKDDLEHLFV